MKINVGWVTTFNNIAIVSKNRLTKLPKAINNREGVFYGCALTTSYGAVFKDSKNKPKKKNKILINGFGMIGQTILKLLENNNQEIHILENNKRKINFFFLINNFSDQIYHQSVNRLKSNYFDIIYETTGNKKIIEKSYNIMKYNSKLILIGVPKFNSKIKINTLGTNYGKQLIGSYGGRIRPKYDLIKIHSHLRKKKLI